MKLKIGTKIALGFISILFVMAVMSCITIIFSRSIESDVNSMNVLNRRLFLEKDTESNFNLAIANVRGLVAYGSPEYKSSYFTDMNNVLTMENQLASLSTPQLKPVVEDLISNSTIQLQTNRNKLIPAIEQQLSATNPAQLQSAKLSVT